MAQLHDQRAEVIAFVGIDGSGKTTVAQRLAAWIGPCGVPAAYLKTASGRSGLDRAAQQAGAADLAGWVGAESALLMEAAIGWRSLREAKALLRRGRSIVVADRWAHCHLALTRLHAPAVEPVVRALFARFGRPALTFFVATPPALGAARVEARGGNAKTLAFLEAFDHAYRALPEAAEYVELDGSATPDAVFEQARAAVAARYPALGQA